jgi:hypothetical protein
MADYYECVDGQVVYCPTQDSCGRGDTAHQNYVYEIFQLVRVGKLRGFIELVQLDREGLEDFGLLSAASSAFPKLLENASQEIDQRVSE